MVGLHLEKLFDFGLIFLLIFGLILLFTFLRETSFVKTDFLINKIFFKLTAFFICYAKNILKLFGFSL